MNILWIILNIIGSLAAAYILKIGLDYNKGMENAAPVNYYDLDPSEINYLLKDVNYMNRAIVATLLDLYRKRNIDINPYSRPARKRNEKDVAEYEFILLSTDNLSEHEVLFLNNIFDNKSKVTTDELTQLSMGSKEFLQKQAKWVNAIESSLVGKGFYGSGDAAKSSKIKILGVAIFALGLISVLKGQYIGLLSILMAMGSLLIGINMGMDKSGFGRSVHSYYEKVEESAMENSFGRALEDRELINLIAMGLTMKYFNPLYKSGPKSEIISPFSDFINESGGSELDDAVLRGFMGFTQKTREDTIDTNRVDFRLFK